MKFKNMLMVFLLIVGLGSIAVPVFVESMQVVKHGVVSKSDSVATQVQSKMNEVAASHGSQIYFLLLAFLAGILVSFTPCVYPMIPITIGILQSQVAQSAWRNFGLTISYVCGIAFVHALLGYLAATSAIIFGQWLSSPWFILLMILFFMYFAFSMFGFYEIYMPRFLMKQRDVSTGGSFLGTFIFGTISGMVASPCLTPVLAFLLGFVAKLANPVMGFLTLFVFALGLGMVLILVGTFSGILVSLPRAGMWMEEIKKVFGFIMLAACVYVAQPILNLWITWILYGSVAFAGVLYFGRKLIKK